MSRRALKMVAVAVLADGAFLFEEDGGKDNLGPLDAKVFNALIHGLVF